MKVYLAADIGGTFTKYGIFNEEGKLLHNWKAPTDIKDTDKIPENISNELMNLVKKHNYKALGLGVGITGREKERGDPKLFIYSNY
jgi:predicted NBD/HSP70 family sugar kinase